jgi:Type IV pili methyl-accepting chemotaxis transducer N-term
MAARAQVSDMGDAINKAGRQRMLSQRMGKAWLALVHGIEVPRAQQVLDASMALFDRQLVELKAYAGSEEIRATYTVLEAAWSSYKAVLVGKVPARANAPGVLQHSAAVLALAHQGTQQYEAALGKPLGKLVNVAGRQRMLSQRMAMYYLAARLPVEAGLAVAEIKRARTEFVSAMVLLHQAQQSTARIQDALQLADGQWVFFEAALQRVESIQPNASRPLIEVFTASENLLTVMDGVTGLYAAQRS